MLVLPVCGGHGLKLVGARLYCAAAAYIIVGVIVGHAIYLLAVGLIVPCELLRAVENGSELSLLLKASCNGVAVFEINPVRNGTNSICTTNSILNITLVVLYNNIIVRINRIRKGANCNLVQTVGNVLADCQLVINGAVVKTVCCSRRGVLVGVSYVPAGAAGVQGKKEFTSFYIVIVRAAHVNPLVTLVVEKAAAYRIGVSNVLEVQGVEIVIVDILVVGALGGGLGCRCGGLGLGYAACEDVVAVFQLIIARVGLGYYRQLSTLGEGLDNLAGAECAAADFYVVL